MKPAAIPFRDLVFILIFFFGLAFLQYRLYRSAGKKINLILAAILLVIGLFIGVLAVWAYFTQGTQ